MKRSRKLTLAVMGLAPIALTACSEKPVDMLVYKTLNECGSDVYYSPQACKTEFDKALKTHRSAAPRYAKLSACESDFGRNRCESMGRFYLPMIAAYMLPVPEQHRSGGYYGGGFGQPLYRTRGGNSYRTGDNYEVGRSGKSGKISTVPSRTKAPSIKTKTVSRGGFGSQAAARGSWGGGKGFGG
ncbi:MAG TPA: DUF1190 domain-containing protein [Chromatiales bacterium]|nr:DUF1190 domain-containing protein [Chromatiales bacterium]